METNLDFSRCLAAALDGAMALVWITIAQSFWRCRGDARPQGALMRLGRVASGLLALHFAVHIVMDLVPFEEDLSQDIVYVVVCWVSLATVVMAMPVLRHLVPLGTLGGHRPGWLWLIINYGSGFVALAVGWVLTPPGGIPPRIFPVYLPLMSLLILWDAGRLVRRRWRPLFMADLGFRGFLTLAVLLLIGVGATVAMEMCLPEDALVSASTRFFLALTLAAPFAYRILGEVVRRFLVTALQVTAAVAVFLGGNGIPASPRLGLVLDGAILISLALILGPGGRWLRSMIDALLLKRSHLWGERLHGFVQTLTPELGIEECCRRSVVEVVDGLSLRGGGLLLEETNEHWAHGRLDLRPIARLWPTGAELPGTAFDLLWLKDVKLQEELYEAGTTWIVPIVSPQKRWGHLFLVAGPIGTAASDTKLEALESFADQLALVLDTASLLARSVGVERDLAAAEKMAALGETAARIAHEIRNPVTAARSLAQLLADEPNSPLNGEHALLVTQELDRVERQVKGLLQFARGEDAYRFESVRLGELVGATVHDLSPCYGSEDLRIEVDVDSDVRVRADAERLRQVVVNLVSNAVDALGDTAPPRRLKVAVARSNGDATLTVQDSGGGVEQEILPHLFEPFVSRKAQGTGLGLAITKRIVEAHDGRIEAEAGPSEGTVFRVSLPVWDPAYS